MGAKLVHKSKCSALNFAERLQIFVTWQVLEFILCDFEAVGASFAHKSKCLPPGFAEHLQKTQRLSTSCVFQNENNDFTKSFQHKLSKTRPYLDHFGDRLRLVFWLIFVTFSVSIFASICLSIVDWFGELKWVKQTLTVPPWASLFGDLFRTSIRRCIVVALGLSLGALLAPFWSPKGLLGLISSPFWRPFGPIWCVGASLGACWLPSGYFLALFWLCWGFQELVWVLFCHLAGPRLHFWYGFEAVGANLVHKHKPAWTQLGSLFGSDSLTQGVVIKMEPTMVLNEQEACHSHKVAIRVWTLRRYLPRGNKCLDSCTSSRRGGSSIMFCGTSEGELHAFLNSFRITFVLCFSYGLHMLIIPNVRCASLERFVKTNIVPSLQWKTMNLYKICLMQTFQTKIMHFGKNNSGIMFGVFLHQLLSLCWC